jgi:Rad3-related DNA helicase
MSATICGADEYAKTLGIPEGQWSYFSAHNPIPLESRMVNVIKGLYLSKSFTKWDTYFKLIDRLMTKHSNERGIVHTVSFDLAKKIQEGVGPINRKRILVSNNMSDIMNWLRDNKNGIVVSASIEKGYDFKDDLSRFQILAKMPFLYLGDPHISLNCKRNSKWYSRQTILRVIQSVGRSIRGVDDHATTYVVDENFLRLTRENYDLFPDWFKDSIRVLN